jgi:hypothetical protein
MAIPEDRVRGMFAVSSRVVFRCLPALARVSRCLCVRGATSPPGFWFPSGFLLVSFWFPPPLRGASHTGAEAETKRRPLGNQNLGGEVGPRTHKHRLTRASAGKHRKTTREDTTNMPLTLSSGIANPPFDTAIRISWGRFGVGFGAALSGEGMPGTS